MKKQAILITSIFAVSTVVQAFSNIVLTRLFGTSIEYGHFLAAVTLPTIFVTVIYGTLNDALMPLYGERLADKENLPRYFFGQLTSFSLLGIFLSGLLILLSKPIMSLFFTDPSLDVSVLTKMFSVMVLAIPFSVFVTMLGMRQYAQKHYSRFPVAQLIGSIVNLALILILYQGLGAWGLVYSFVLNIAVQIVFVKPEIPKIRLGDITPALMLWAPLIIGIFAIKSDSLLIRSLSSSLGTESIVYHNLIAKIGSLSAGLLTIGMQIVLLPNIIESVGKKDYHRTKSLVNKAKVYAFSLSLLLSIALLILAPFFIKILFVGGKFTIQDFEKSVKLLPYYTLPVVGWGTVSIYIQPLYALKKHYTVGLIALSCLMLAWVVSKLIAPISVSLAISIGLSILLLGSAAGAEILWRYYFSQLQKV